MTLGVDDGPIASLRDAPAIASAHDDEPDIAIAGTQTFGRLRALIARGYRPDFAQSEDGCLLLTHPRRRFKYRHMLLDSSGAVQWLHDRDYKMHFARWEKKRFERFLRDVPMPGWWDRTHGYRKRILAFVIGALLCAAIYAVVLQAVAMMATLAG